MNPIFQAAQNLQNFCEQTRWKFCFIGGLAVQRWGQPRMTMDVDMTLLTGFGNEQYYIKKLLQQFTPRRSDAAEFAVKNRVLLIKDENRTPFDIALGAIPFEENAIRRSSIWIINQEFSLRTCSAEDLIVHKSFANRGIDWFDIESILQRQQGVLNIQQIRDDLKPLAELKEEPEILTKLERMITAYR